MKSSDHNWYIYDYPISNIIIHMLLVFCRDFIVFLVGIFVFWPTVKSNKGKQGYSMAAHLSGLVSVLLALRDKMKINCFYAIKCICVWYTHVQANAKHIAPPPTANWLKPCPKDCGWVAWILEYWEVAATSSAPLLQFSLSVTRQFVRAKHKIIHTTILTLGHVHPGNEMHIQSDTHTYIFIGTLTPMCICMAQLFSSSLASGSRDAWHTSRIRNAAQLQYV